MKSVSIILLMLLIYSCKKNELIKLHISAIHALSDEAIENLNFIITEEKLGENGAKEIVYKGVLNENGVSELEFKMDKNSVYTVNLLNQENFEICYNSIEKAFFSPTRLNKKFVFEIIPCAYIKTKIVNTDCQSSDNFYLNYRFNAPIYYSYSETDFYRNYNGCVIDTSSDFRKVYAGTFNLKWSFNLSSQYYYDTIFLLPGEKKVLDFDY